MSDYVKPQPAPQPGTAQPSWDLVIADLNHQCAKGIVATRDIWRLVAEDAMARDTFGAAKYGTRHQHDNGRDHAVDAYQEALDGAMYWRAEWEHTQDDFARALYDSALYHAMHCRDYLYRRDGK